jgi:hypothetical protein
MPLYHFELIGAGTIASLDGALAEDNHQAAGIALGVAEEVRTAKPWLTAKGYEIVVRDEEGNEIGRVAVDPA